MATSIIVSIEKLMQEENLEYRQYPMRIYLNDLNNGRNTFSFRIYSNYIHNKNS